MQETPDIPDPEPEPEPEPDPDPEPQPDPDPEPASEPEPDPGPHPDPDPVPETGDVSSAALWAGSLIAAMSGGAALLIGSRKKHGE